MSGDGDGYVVCNSPMGGDGDGYVVLCVTHQWVGMVMGMLCCG